jgi:hypothetical protein
MKSSSSQCIAVLHRINNIYLVSIYPKQSKTPNHLSPCSVLLITKRNGKFIRKMRKIAMYHLKTDTLDKYDEKSFIH